MSKGQFNNVCSKYKHLPDNYYGGDSQHVITPEKFAREHFREQAAEDELTFTIQLSVKKQMWEWYCGSAALSTYFKHNNISHFPPIDYRYGWNISNSDHQLLLVKGMLSVGVDTLFASPNCAAWG